MRQSFMLLFSLIIFVLGFQSSVTALENHLTFRVNGHEHKIDDIITAEIHRQYLINKPIYEDDFRNKAVDGSLTIIEASLNDKPGRIIYSSDPLDPTKLNIDIIIKNNRAHVRKQIVLWNFIGWRATVWPEATVSFDLWIKIKGVISSDSIGVCLKVSEAQFDASTIKLIVSEAYFPLNIIIEPTLNWFAARLGALDTEVDKPLGELVGESFSLLPLEYFDEDKQVVVNGVDFQSEFDALIKSVPMELQLNTNPGSSNKLNLHSGVSINLKFLHGKSTANGIDPIYDNELFTPSESRNLDYVGINGNGCPNCPEFSTEERIARILLS